MPEEYSVLIMNGNAETRSDKRMPESSSCIISPFFYCDFNYKCHFFFFFFGCPMQHAGSQFPNQGWNTCPLRWKHSLNPWTTKEVPNCNFITCSVSSTDLHLLLFFFVLFFAEILDGYFWPRFLFLSPPPCTLQL